MSINNYSVGTPEKEKESEREYPLVVELLKSRLSTLEKQGWEGCYCQFASESKDSEWNR